VGVNGAVVTLAILSSLFDCGGDHGGARAQGPAQASAEPAKVGATLDLAAELARPERRATRRQRFARAVEKISRDLGASIDGARALEEAPCGGWSGPGCSNLTLGLEAAKLVAPIAARLYDDRAARIAGVLIEAVTTHSVWHDAFGYVHDKLGRGPGYAYAGCLLSSCGRAHLGPGRRHAVPDRPRARRPRGARVRSGVRAAVIGSLVVLAIGLAMDAVAVAARGLAAKALVEHLG
jgi:hypothetical protein